MHNDTWTIDCLSNGASYSSPQPSEGGFYRASKEAAQSHDSGSLFVDERPLAAIDTESRVRRFESAKTDRLNQAHWQYASEQHINVDLACDLPTLWARCTYEAANNPLIEGIIETHITDVIGENGPTCQIEPRVDVGDSPAWSRYTAEAEDLIRELNETGWDAQDDLSLVDMLALWLWSEWTLGDIIGQEVTAPIRNGVQVRVNPIDPRRLNSPWSINNPDIALGVERDPKTGRRTQYWFTEPRDNWRSSFHNARAIDARYIYHDYRRREIGQVRGIPLLSGSLQVVADLRDFDTQTLDAARSAADFAAVAFTNSVDADFVAVDPGLNTPIKRRRITHLPPGWDIKQLAPTHPSTQYIDFRRERLREVGRAVCMPLMTILLDASEHNYSSARMDGQNYQRALRRMQQRLQRKIINPFIYTYLEEAERRGIIAPRPGRIRATWLWDQIPHVDPSKEASADALLLANYQLGPYTAASRANRDFEKIAREWKRANDHLAKLGLPPLGAAVAAQPKPEAPTPATTEG